MGSRFRPKRGLARVNGLLNRREPEAVRHHFGLSVWIIGAAAGVGAAQGRVDDRRCAADTALNRDGLGLAVERTRATLHAGVLILDLGQPIRNLKDRMWADDFTDTTADAQLPIELEGRHIAEVDETTHPTPREIHNEVSQSASPTDAAVIWSGTATRISRLTPDNEV